MCRAQSTGYSTFTLCAAIHRMQLHTVVAVSRRFAAARAAPVLLAFAGSGGATVHQPRRMRAPPCAPLCAPRAGPPPPPPARPRPRRWRAAPRRSGPGGVACRCGLSAPATWRPFDPTRRQACRWCPCCAGIRAVTTVCAGPGCACRLQLRRVFLEPALRRRLPRGPDRGDGVPLLGEETQTRVFC